MNIFCHTNLDLRNEEWPTELSAVPQVGQRIESKTARGRFHLVLEVVAVTWTYNFRTSTYFPQVELHLPSKRFKSLTSFYEWYAPIIGSSISSFI
jgi:hypothetical protein